MPCVRIHREESVFDITHSNRIQKLVRKVLSDLRNIEQFEAVLVAINGNLEKVLEEIRSFPL